MARVHWLALATLGGLGGATARRLLDRFGSVEAVFGAAPEALAGVPRVTRAMAEQLLAAPFEALEAELHRLAAEGIELLTWDDPGFPAHLKALPDAPLVLFLRGSLRPDDARAVAIVGTRDPSPAGVETATRLARELAARGLAVVSGLALGIDAAAHRGALQAAGGRTLAVLGSGLRAIHPKAHADLAEQVAARGALLSELRPTARPRGPQLMARDRIISGLSRAVIVVEAAEQSGSLDTAARAAKQGRLVFAVPGSPGATLLLAAGARPLGPGAIDYDALAETIARHPLPTGPDQPPPSLRQAALF